MADDQLQTELENQKPPPASAVVERCADFAHQLEKLGNMVLYLTIGNVTTVVVFLLYTIVERETLVSSYYQRMQFDFLLVLVLMATISMLVLSVLALMRFQRKSQSARIYLEETSDSLGWYRKTEKAPVVTDVKIALRELAARAELPLASGRQGYLTYFLLNTIVVVLFVTFIASTLVNLGVKTLGSVAMPCYSHLSDAEREQIGLAKAVGHSIGAIAEAIGRPKSTVSRELSRNRLPSGRLLAASRRRSLSMAQAA
jgi:hypothetical protein